MTIAWLWAALVIPSWAVVAKFTGLPGVVIYSAGVAVALLLVPKIVPQISRRFITAMSLMTLLAVVLLFALVYPRVNAQSAGAGSDDDDAHNVGVAALFAGESPYSRQTYLGNALHQLPGAYLIAAPFVALGTSALQNLVCLPLFFALVGRRSQDARTPLVLAWLVLLLSPSVLHQVVTGSSYSWNAIWVWLGIWWVCRQPASVIAPIFCGVAMCSRANFLFLLAPLYGMLCRSSGRNVAIRAVVIATITAIALVLPFYIASAEFGPLEGFATLDQFSPEVPGAGIAILVFTAIVAISLSTQTVDLDGLFLQCAIIQAIPVMAVLMLSAAVDGGTRWVSLTSYATFASWFVLANLRVWRRCIGFPNTG